MNELRLLRDALPQPQGPAAETIATGRVMLARQYTKTNKTTRGTSPWRIRRRAVLAVGAGVAVAAAVAVVLAPQGSLQVANARDLGDRAALSAEHEPYTTPRPDQWIYRRERQASGWDMNAWWKGANGPLETNDHWWRVDGHAAADIVNGKLRVLDFDHPGAHVVYSGGPMYTVRNYATLPTDPDSLLRSLRKPYPNQVGPTTDADVFDTIVGMLSDPLPPKLHAALFRSLPALHGVTLQRDAADVTGRKGIGFALTDDWERKVLIIDPHTYHYLGMYDYAVKDHHRAGDPGTVKKGTYLIQRALLDSRIVDHPGQHA